MVTHVGVTGGPATYPDRDEQTGLDRTTDPHAPVQVNVIVGAQRIAPVWVDRTDPPPQNTPLVLVAGPDQVLRVKRLDTTTAPDHTHPPAWGDRVRYGTTAPTDAAPVGVVHVNATDGRIYRNGV